MDKINKSQLDGARADLEAIIRKIEDAETRISLAKVLGKLDGVSRCEEIFDKVDAQFSKNVNSRMEDWSPEVADAMRLNAYPPQS